MVAWLYSSVVAYRLEAVAVLDSELEAVPGSVAVAVVPPEPEPEPEPEHELPEPEPEPGLEPEPEPELELELELELEPEHVGLVATDAVVLAHAVPHVVAVVAVLAYAAARNHWVPGHPVVG